MLLRPPVAIHHRVRVGGDGGDVLVAKILLIQPVHQADTGQPNGELVYQ
jgi:hypothetical protein